MLATGVETSSHKLLETDSSLWRCITSAGQMVHLQLSRVLNGNFCGGCSALWSNGFHLLQNIHALNHLAKYYVLAIQPRKHMHYTFWSTAKWFQCIGWGLWLTWQIIYILCIFRIVIECADKIWVGLLNNILVEWSLTHLCKYLYAFLQVFPYTNCK